MRQTYSQLQTQAQNYALNDTSSGTLTFLQNEINLAQRFIMAELKNWQIQRVQTFSTVINQQFYHMPPDAIDIQSVTITIASIPYPLQEIDNQKAWDQLNELTITPTAVSEYFFQRKRDFGIYPTPQAVYTGTMTYQPKIKDMTTSDYVTGTLTATNNSQTITGSGTTWTSGMIGRWLQVTSPTGDGFWYKITAASATSITLEEAYQGTTAAGASYTIGESPELPEEAHPLLAYRAAEAYFAGFRKDIKLAQYWGNMFWTGNGQITRSSTTSLRDVHGGLLGLKKRYAKRSESRIIRANPAETDFGDNYWWANSIKNS